MIRGGTLKQPMQDSEQMCSFWIEQNEVRAVAQLEPAALAA